jgi:hypothetical protein
VSNLSRSTSVLYGDDGSEVPTRIAVRSDVLRGALKDFRQRPFFSCHGMDVVEQPSASLPAESEMNFFGRAEIIELSDYCFTIRCLVSVGDDNISELEVLPINPEIEI